MPTATPVLVVGTAEKAAGDGIRIPLDWGDEPAFIDALTDANGNYDPDANVISSYDITISGTGAPTISLKQKDYNYSTSAFVSAGSAGSYNLVYTVTLNDADGTQLSRTGALTIK